MDGRGERDEKEKGTGFLVSENYDNSAGTESGAANSDSCTALVSFVGVLAQEWRPKISVAKSVSATRIKFAH